MSFVIYDNVDRHLNPLIPVGLTELPHLKEIFLCSEKPDDINFDLFDKLENIEDVTLYVPCFCAKAYYEYKRIFKDNKGQKSQEIDYPYNKFQHIEEFDPADLFEDYQ